MDSVLKDIIFICIKFKDLWHGQIIKYKLSMQESWVMCEEGRVLFLEKIPNTVRFPSVLDSAQAAVMHLTVQEPFRPKGKPRGCPQV